MTTGERTSLQRCQINAQSPLPVLPLTGIEVAEAAVEAVVEASELHR